MEERTCTCQMQQNKPPPPPNNCKSGALRKCVNCKGKHASTNKSCPVLKEHIKGLFENKKNKTYSEILAKQQKQIYDNQQKQETRITTIHSTTDKHRTNAKYNKYSPTNDK